MALCAATLGVILAGGLARRMGGGDKPLLELEGQTLLTHVEQRLSPQCEGVILNANGEPSRFAETGLPVVQDSIPGQPGPLAGILAAMEWAALHRPSDAWIVSVPGDTPFIPNDLVFCLHAACKAAQVPVACAGSGSRAHYTTALWSVGLRHDLRHALTVKGIRRVEDWAKSQGLVTVFWPVEPFDPFFNINTPEELDAARTLVERQAAPL